MGVYSSFSFPDGVTLFGAGREYSFDVEEPTFGEAEVVVETEMESWLIPALENAYAGNVRVIPVDTGGELRLSDTDFRRGDDVGSVYVGIRNARPAEQ